MKEKDVEQEEAEKIRKKGRFIIVRTCTDLKDT
jgi:hypothetical protein